MLISKAGHVGKEGWNADHKGRGRKITIMDQKDADEPPLILESLPETVLLEIASLLSPRSLASLGSSSIGFSRLAFEELTSGPVGQWEQFYKTRWNPLSSSQTSGDSWHKIYSQKMRSLGCFGGRFSLDSLRGHRAGVRAAKMLVSSGILASGSLDKTVRIWDLSTGLSTSVSKPHGGTVRAIAMDDDLLVTGSADSNMRAWLKSASNSKHPTFDVSAAYFDLPAHNGPVSSLSMTNHALFSGSWDCSVRTFARGTDNGYGPAGLKLSNVLQFSDWVLSVVARGRNLLVAAGSEVCCHDLLTGQLVRKFQDLHESNVSAVEGTHNSEMLFTAAGEGLVMAHDLRMKHGSRLIWHHNAGVQSLSFDDPWLASACSDGTVLLMDIQAQLRGGGSGSSRSTVPACHKHLHTPAGPAYCVDIADQRVVCGSESDSIRVWDFSQAKAAADRAAEAKLGRNSRKSSRRKGLSSGIPTLSHPWPSGLVQRNVGDDHLLGTSPPELPPILEVLEPQRAPPGHRVKWWSKNATWSKHRSVGQEHNKGGESLDIHQK